MTWSKTGPLSLPAPEPCLVIRHSSLWLREHRQGREESTKARPCAIVLAVQDRDGPSQVLTVPVAHTPPESPETALDLPAAIKQHLGLKAEHSRVVLSASSLSERRGPDLRRVANRDDSSLAHGFLPAPVPAPRLTAAILSATIEA